MACSGELVCVFIGLRNSKLELILIDHLTFYCSAVCLFLYLLIYFMVIEALYWYVNDKYNFLIDGMSLFQVQGFALLHFLKFPAKL